MRVLLMAAVPCLWVAASCAPSADACVTGNEGCGCWANATCNDGLSCRSKLCVKLERSERPGTKPPSESDTHETTTMSEAGADAPFVRRGANAGAGGMLGAGGARASSPPSAGRAATCKDAGASCGSNADCCGVPCVQGVCADGCGTREDCASDCCFELNSGESVCAPATVCPAPDAPDCAAAGADCSIHSCCGGASCIQDVCAAKCSDDTDCGSRCCYKTSSGTALCAPPSLCAPPPGADAGVALPTGGSGGGLTPITTCNKPTLVADDGKYLGVASSSVVTPEGVCNEVSPYGSEVGPYSIHNNVGIYGSAVSPQSAYNEVTPTPPHLRCESGKLLNAVTKNKVIANGIDPDVLCETLAANGY
jgi:hypothetical protein